MSLSLTQVYWTELLTDLPRNCIILEAGNTRAKLYFGDQRVAIHWRKDVQNLEQTLKQWTFTDHDAVAPTVIWSSVNNQFKEHLLGLLRNTKHVEVSLLIPHIQRILNSHSVVGIGTDRMLNALGACLIQNAKNEQVKHSLISIDFGTATTFQFLDDKGHLQGGAIALGLRSGIESLHTNAPALPEFEEIQNIFATEHPFIAAKSTASAIVAGAVGPLIAYVNQMIQTVAGTNGKVDIVLSGGNLKYILPAIKNFLQSGHVGRVYVCEDTNAIGLARAYQEFCGKNL